MNQPGDARAYYVYMLANRSRSTYVGVTNDLQRRVAEHKSKSVPGFTSRYNIDLLVYYEQSDNIEAAIAREKEIKAWSRAKKFALIESCNPGWQDLELS